MIQGVVFTLPEGSLTQRVQVRACVEWSNVVWEGKEANLQLPEVRFCRTYRRFHFNLVFNLVLCRFLIQDGTYEL